MTEIIDYAIQNIRDYVYYIEEMGSWRGMSFEDKSFTKWVAMEIIKRMKQTNQPPLLTLELFREEMYMYSCSNEKTSFIFSRAIDTVEDIDDLLINN